MRACWTPIGTAIARPLRNAYDIAIMYGSWVGAVPNFDLLVLEEQWKEAVTVDIVSDSKGLVGAKQCLCHPPPKSGDGHKSAVVAKAQEAESDGEDQEGNMGEDCLVLRRACACRIVEYGAVI